MNNKSLVAAAVACTLFIVAADKFAGNYSALQNQRVELERIRHELQQEPRDERWARDVERSIWRFLNAQPGIAAFDISYVECRTKTCQIEAVGFGAGDEPRWWEMMRELQDQMPDDMQQWGSFGLVDNGHHAVVQTFERHEWGD